MNILVAENDALESGVLRDELERGGNRVTSVTNGKKAWEILEGDETFDLVIAAQYLPSVNGLTLRKRLHELKNGTAPYFILLSDGGDDDTRQQSIEVGVNDFLVKPLNNSELETRLEVARRIIGAAKPVVKPLGLLDEAGAKAESPSLPLGEILIAYDLITYEQLQTALAFQKVRGGEIGEILISEGWATEENITLARSVQLDMPYVAVAAEKPEIYLLEKIPEEMALRWRILPISLYENEARGGKVVRVAVSDPHNVEGLDVAQRMLGRPVEAHLANEAALLTVIENVYREIKSDKQDLLLTESLEETLAAQGQNLIEEDDEVGEFAIVEEAPIIRFINSLFADAVRRRASDIHIEPYKRDFEIRYRIDGELHVIHTLPRATLAAMTSRVKVIADLDIAERRMPQDGRISIKVEGTSYDMRVSTLPTQYGERVVMRVLDRSAANRSLDELGFSGVNRDRFESLIHKPHGIILVTGPTGSGKTTTLYAALNALKSPTINIMTCEDPIEYELDRIGQSAVNVRAGLTFAAQLRAILRQDPDVVLVGEIRDQETAETAFRAALTGHLVLSTLHCNEAMGAPTRLADMGVPAFLIASALIGSVAQRLVRRICPHCRQLYQPSPAKLSLLEEYAGVSLHGDQLYEAAPGGCAKCGGAGTRGRMAVHEVALIDEKIQSLIMRGAETSILRDMALEGGMVPMVADGIDKARRGLTTLDDVQRKVGTLGVPIA